MIDKAGSIEAPTLTSLNKRARRLVETNHLFADLVVAVRTTPAAGADDG
jgi:hypothetical protein